MWNSFRCRKHKTLKKLPLFATLCGLSEFCSITALLCLYLSSVVRVVFKNLKGHICKPVIYEEELSRLWHGDYPFTGKAASTSIVEEFASVLSF